jgi:hypothetical protein
MRTDYILQSLALVNVVPFTAYVHPKGLCSEAELFHFHVEVRLRRSAMRGETNLVFEG